MSKSAELDASRINLLDTPKDVQNKIKRAKTDAGEGLEYDNPERPEARNLLTLYALATGHSLVSLAYVASIYDRLYILAKSGRIQIARHVPTVAKGLWLCFRCHCRSFWDLGYIFTPAIFVPAMSQPDLSSQPPMLKLLNYQAWGQQS